MLLSMLNVAMLAVYALTFSGLVEADEASNKDRQLYAGTWRLVSAEVSGNKLSEEDAKKILVINKEDGSWTMQSEGKVIARGTSKIDPTKKPKAIDLTNTEGEEKGKTYPGIYAVEENFRKICLAQPGKQRPTEFSAKPGSGHVLVVFTRVQK